LGYLSSGGRIRIWNLNCTWRVRNIIDEEVGQYRPVSTHALAGGRRRDSKSGTQRGGAGSCLGVGVKRGRCSGGGERVLNVSSKGLELHRVGCGINLRFVLGGFRGLWIGTDGSPHKFRLSPAPWFFPRFPGQCTSSPLGSPSLFSAEIAYRMSPFHPVRGLLPSKTFLLQPFLTVASGLRGPLKVCWSGFMQEGFRVIDVDKVQQETGIIFDLVSSLRGNRRLKKKDNRGSFKGGSIGSLGHRS